MKSKIVELIELVLYLVPVVCMILVKITEKYCDFWYYLLCAVALIAQIGLFFYSKQQQKSIAKQKENFDDTFQTEYDDEGNIKSIKLDGGTF